MIKKFKKIFSNNDKEDIELIRKSKYFDEKYYLLENPKIKGDPCRHYYYYGWKEGKSPSFEFSNNFYLKNYKDVEDAGINPLIHYLKFGKAENRVIEKDNGLTLKKVYERVYNCVYFYKTYIYDTDIKRLNLLFDSIDNSVEKMYELLEYIAKFCNKKEYKLRIIYFKADFTLLKRVLEDKKIILPKDTTFLNLKSSNYLEVGFNEKYVCTTWKTARALLNTASINEKVYYYLPDNIKKLSYEEFYQVSNICMNEHVILMTNKKENINYVKKCNLKFEVGNLPLKLKKANQLYCDFDKMFIVGVEILNEMFLTDVLESNAWRVNILESNYDFKFHFETNVSIRKTFSIDDNADLIFNISYEKKDISYDRPFINAWVEEEKVKIKDYILINNDNFEKILNNEKYSISTIDNYYDEFRKCISTLKNER